MRAAVVHGGGRQLSIETIADPTPVDDEVVIAVPGALEAERPG